MRYATRLVLPMSRVHTAPATPNGVPRGPAHGALRRAGKPVFAAEYGPPRERFCARARALGISAIRKRLSLGPWRQAC